MINSLWIGSSLSTVEQLAISSFLAHGHEFCLYTYEPVTGVPDGTTLKDANEILPASQIFTYKGGSYAGFADWFRWELLSILGGYWVDMDVICLKPFPEISQIVVGLESADKLCPAVLGFPPRHQVSQTLAHLCKHPNTWMPYDSPRHKAKKAIRYLLGNKRHKIGWGEAGGPKGLTHLLNDLNLMSLAFPQEAFFPVSCDQWERIYKDPCTDLLTPDSYAVHLWNEMSRRDTSFNKNSTFPPNSLFETLKSKHL